MSANHRQQLSLLSIPSGQPYQAQSHFPLYSPALPTAIHQGFPSAFPPPTLLQTPVQPSFFPPPFGAPHRSLHQGHRAQTSVSLAAAGIHPPPGIPVTPLQQSQFPPAFGGPQFPPFQHRNRRQPSISTGGPPKAQLGGVGKNYRPPSPTAVALVNVAAQNQKVKKTIVNLPKETTPAVDEKPPERAHFARTPIPLHLIPPQPSPSPPDVISAVIHPEDSLRTSIPDTVDVFLPAKPAWEVLKKKFIEERLEKLGIEKGSGSSSTVPHIHAPHARAASISSPADPALLFFKLNKLQQVQISQAHSASVSPQPSQHYFDNATPPLPMSQQQLVPPPPSHSAPLRHGHSLSLAAVPFVPSRPFMAFNAPMGYNLLGHSATIASDGLRSPDTRSDPGAPTDQSLAPPAMPARADSRPDFMRGFGLDVPEETEEELEQEQEQAEQDGQDDSEGHEEERVLAEASHVALMGSDTMSMDLDVDEADAEVSSITTAAQSRVHSRHVSRLSASLSLLTVGGHVSDREEIESDAIEQGERGGDSEDDAVGEWTGSEDMRTTTETTEDEESIGEWSNPSDEERARQQRQQRRLLRRAHVQRQQESSLVPRRIPDFPHPPVNPLTSLLSHPRPDTEEDMISNPSDDNVNHPFAHPFRHSSRPPSSRLSFHDPALAHSRTPSSNLMPTPFQLPMPIPIQAPVPKHTEALNPHAKPFVFTSANRRSGSFTPETLGLPMPQPQVQQQPHVPELPRAFGHARAASFGKPLNAGAPEFKPGTFTFTPPPNMPKFPVPQPPAAPPALPSPPPPTSVNTNSMRPQQGREKRQRRDSVGSAARSEASEDGINVMTSFKFPQESPTRKSAPTSPEQQREVLGAAARSLTLPGLGAIKITATAHNVESPVSEGPTVGEGDRHADEDTDEEVGESGDMEHELPIPLSMKARRAPIPLDFKHPVSTNTVPAGLFKALASGSGNNGSGNSASAVKESEKRARRIVRSRLSSREIFEHASRPSLDDLCVPAISQNASRGRLVTDPGRWDAPTMLQEPPQQAHDRRTSLPAMSSTRSSFSNTSDHPQDTSRHLELQHYEERLEALLESKLDDFREEVRAMRLEAGTNGGTGSASTDAAINEVVSLFRAQLQESAARGLDDSQMDARGELDFQLVKDIVEQGHAEARAMIQLDLDRILRRVEALQSAEVTPIIGGNTEAMLEEYHTRTRNTVVGAVAPITARLEALERTRTRTPLPPPQAPLFDHEALVRELHAALVPHVVASRAEPIDYELLTEQLSQAVKPHISQLIDLASDKRETAGLIVDRLIPVLPTIYPPAGNSMDIPAVVGQVTAEMRRLVAPLDAHEIKEQVSDLVVERLDSRMAVRDRALDGLSSKLADGVDRVLEPLNDVASRVVEVSKGQEALSIQTRDLACTNNDTMTLLSGLPEQLSGTIEPLRTMLADLISTTSTFGNGQTSPEDLLRIGSTVESLSTGQQALQVKATELLALHQNVLSRLTELPENMAAVIKAAQTAQAELLARTVTKEDFEEVRKMMATNADLQVQLAKARAQYGAVRAEKDIVMERITFADAERDQLRAKVDEIQAIMLLRATDAATAQARTMELEEASAQSLARLKASDVTIENQRERLFELEKLNKELTSEKQALVSKVHSLEAQAGFTSRDKDAAVEALAALRAEHDAMLAQQTHWEDLRRTTEKLEHLSALVTRSQANEPELKELRRVRDRSKVLESEHASLQRRYKEQEARADEWEQRANEHEAALADAQAALEDAEDRVIQLVEEHAEAKTAEERLAKDRENRLRDQVAALEGRVAQLQFSAAQASKKAALASSPPRPDSRASTIYPSRSATPIANADVSTKYPSRSASQTASAGVGTIYTSRSGTPTASAGVSRVSTPPTSVWDSIHAPSVISRKQGPVPRSRFVNQDWPSRVASPTPSVTLGSDGWYE